MNITRYKSTVNAWKTGEGCQKTEKDIRTGDHVTDSIDVENHRG